jgi:hypothetical protein
MALNNRNEHIFRIFNRIHSRKKCLQKCVDLIYQSRFDLKYIKLQLINKCSKQAYFRGVFYMAKESETSSAVKKKKATKKKTTTQKTTRKTTAAAKKTKSPAKKTAAKKTAAKKTAAKKTTQKTTAKKNTTSKSSKVAATSTKKLSPKEILFLKFNSWTPDTPFSVSLPSSENTNHTAPPFFEGKNDSEKNRLGNLLLKKFDYELILSEGFAAMKAAEEEARRKAEEEAKRKAEEEARRKAEEEAKRKAEEEAKRKAEEEAKRKAEEEARRKAEEEAKRKAEEEAKRKAEEEAKRKAEEEAKRKAEEEAKRKAEEEAKRKAEEEAKRKAEEEAKRKAEEEAKRKAEEEARRKAEEEARRKAAEKAKLQAMMQKAEEARLAEAARKAEEEKIANLTTGEKISIAMKESKPMNKTMIYAGAFFAFIFAVLIFASASNVNNYYLKATDTGVEIWQGKFAPLGEKLILAMPGVEAPETIKSSYSKKEVYPLAFEYYVDHSKDLLDKPGIPDFEAIKTEFEKALDYATLPQQQKIVQNHLTTIDLMILTYKADVFAGGGTSEDYQKALDYLGEATRLELNPQQIKLVKEKMNTYRNAAKTTIMAETGEEEAAEEIDKLYSWKNVRREEGKTEVSEETAEKEVTAAPQESVEETDAEMAAEEAEDIEKIENIEEETTAAETPAEH